MAVLDAKYPTLFDLSQRMTPDGSIETDIVEMLNSTNEILDDMVWQEGNLITGHKSTIRTGLPTPTWRKLYGGVQPSKSATRQITDNCGNLEDYSRIDRDLAMLNGNSAAWRMTEDAAHIEGISQELAETIFYGDEGVDEAKFTGLVPRFNDPTAENGSQLINAGATTGTLQSIWLVVWGPQSLFGIVPKGSRSGIEMRDLGEDTVAAPDGNGLMQALTTHYKVQAGLTVRDWRYVARICNIDVATLKAHPTIGTDVVLPDLMYSAMERVQNLNGRAAFYMSRSVREKVRQQTVNLTSNSTLSMENVGGKMLMNFQGIPMKRVDALATDETAITFA